MSNDDKSTAVCTPASTTPADASRRKLLKTTALAAAGAGLYGVAPFHGPWKHNHAWAQAAAKKPLVIGLTMDASGQYAASGSMERLGAMIQVGKFHFRKDKERCRIGQIIELSDKRKFHLLIGIC